MESVPRSLLCDRSVNTFQQISLFSAWSVRRLYNDSYRQNRCQYLGVLGSIWEYLSDNQGKFVVWRLGVWFEGFMCAVVQWYWKCVIKWLINQLPTRTASQSAKQATVCWNFSSLSGKQPASTVPNLEVQGILYVMHPPLRQVAILHYRHTLCVFQRSLTSTLGNMDGETQSGSMLNIRTECTAIKKGSIAPCSSFKVNGYFVGTCRLLLQGSS
jgi:hypothetical protein